MKLPQVALSVIFIKVALLNMLKYDLLHKIYDLEKAKEEIYFLLFIHYINAFSKEFKQSCKTGLSGASYSRQVSNAYPIWCFEYAQNSSKCWGENEPSHFFL